MSSSDENSLTLTWEIENFKLILEAEEDSKLIAVVGKKYTKHSLRQLVVYHKGPDIRFELLYSLDHVSFICEGNVFDVKLISTSGEVHLKRYESRNYASFRIAKTSIFSNNTPSTILPNDTVTLRFKVRKEAIKTEEFRIHSVLQRENFFRNVTVYSVIGGEYIDFVMGVKDDQPDSTPWTIHDPESKYFIVTLKGMIRLEYLFSFVDCMVSWGKYNMKDIKYCYDSMKTECTCTITMDTSDWYKACEELNPQFNAIVAFHKFHPHQKARQFSAESFEEDSNEFAMPSSTLNKDLLYLYREALHSDATIKAGGKSFPVHMNILSTRSEVFRAKFEKDRLRNVVVDADSETVDRMLVYLYGDSLEDLHYEEALALYYLADKYAIHLLKQKCSDFLKTDGLTTDNACNILVLANANSDEKLTQRVVDFLSDHQEVMSSSEWLKLEESHTRLTTKVLREILLKKK